MSVVGARADRASKPERRHRFGRHRSLALLAVLAVGLAASGCVFPKVPPYPYWGPYGSRQGVINEAQRRSDALQQYVKDFLDGKVPATVPVDLLPDGRDKAMTNYTVQTEGQIDPAKQWVVRHAMTIPIDRSNSPGLYPDPAATYLVMPNYLAPFGSKALVTGSFPHSRFFSIQATESFQPENYHGKFGVGEVPIVDADIDPAPGSTNPFRVGANRNATNRNYTVTLESQIGNAVALTDAYKPAKNFRAAGNTRPTSGLRYNGPWGDPNYQDSSPLVGHQGLWDDAWIWVRYYVPDANAGALGGVALPKVTYQLPDGRKYFISADLTQMSANMNAAEPIMQEAPAEPDPAKCGPTVGWAKNWGILRNGLQVANVTWGSGPNPQYVRDVEKGASGKAEDLPAPGNYESTESLVPYTHYLGRCMSVGTNKVAVLTGRKPTTPKTRGAQATMTGAQARFWSITTYDDSLDLSNTSRPFGQPIAYVNDEDVVTDATGHYTIVFSRAEDRPANATAANGVTWVDWGPKGNSFFFLRWMAVGPQWTSAKTPDEINLGRGSDVSSVNYNPNLIGRNDQTGFLGEYQPITHYLDKTAFQNLGTSVKWNQIPTW